MTLPSMDDFVKRPERRPRSYLRRLPAEWYRGQAIVHWSMTMEGRATGWLNERFHGLFRERLTHMGFLYHLLVPVYCLMPDHLHLLLVGVHQHADQRVALRFLRRQLNDLFRPAGFALQKQAYDHVLRAEHEIDRDGFQEIAWYIRANPIRAGLIPDERTLPAYPFLGCVLPGFPEVSLWQEDYWTRFWRIQAFRVGRERSGGGHASEGE